MNDRTAYFDFILEYYMLCIKEAGPSYVCAKSLLPPALFVKVDKCYNESFESKYKDVNLEDNTVLDSDIKLAMELNVMEVPEIYVNKQPMWGSLAAKNVLEAICARIYKKPEICYTEGGFSMPKPANTWVIVLTIIAICLGISVIVFILCKKFMDRRVKSDLINSEIDLKVNTVVTNYLALKDKN